MYKFVAILLSLDQTSSEWHTPVQANLGNSTDLFILYLLVYNNIALRFQFTRLVDKSINVCAVQALTGLYCPPILLSPDYWPIYLGPYPRDLVYTRSSSLARVVAREP